MEQKIIDFIRTTRTFKSSNILSKRNEIFITEEIYVIQGQEPRAIQLYCNPLNNWVCISLINEAKESFVEYSFSTIFCGFVYSISHLDTLLSSWDELIVKKEGN